MTDRCVKVLVGWLLWAGMSLGQDAPLSLKDAPAPAPLKDAARRMEVPEGFQVTLFAGEPDVVQPIAMAFDDRGRLWVVECLSYPAWQTDPKAKGTDRVLIFEDADGDGRFDRRKVFWDQGVNLSGIEIGFGGVWLCATPNLSFLPDRDGDDVPDGPPVALLDGFSLQMRHNVFNTLLWGPDGWLYGCHGIVDTSRVGKPGTPDDQRVPMNCGVWRFHPTRHVFEPVAWGTTNPWGLDFDQHGQMFITNCVIKHLFHVVPGAHFVRMYGQDLNPNVYGLIESCADHIHWGGGAWQTSRGGQGEHDRPGGGHAHAGAMIYLGDNWPPEYRNHVFMCNIHGNRINQDVLVRKGSGYVAQHDRDVLFANDPWFRGLVLKFGPDGGVYVADWCDSGECHDSIETHKTSGRIYQVTFRSPRPARIDVARLEDDELVSLHGHPNEWHCRHARRILQERASSGRLAPQTRPALERMLAESEDVPGKLRALWTLHAIGAASQDLLVDLLANPAEHLRGWSVRLLVEKRAVPSEVLARFVEMARSDASALVRLELASALGRLVPEHRWSILVELAEHAEDAYDAYLPLMIWYGIEPIVGGDPARAASFIQSAKVPLVRQYVARRLSALARGTEPSVHLDPLVKLLQEVPDDDIRLDVLTGMEAGLRGRKDVRAPAGWPQAYAKLAEESRAEIRDKAVVLSLVFGDQAMADSLRAALMDPARAPADRRSALVPLVEQRVGGLAPLLQRLLAEPALCRDALRALAAYDDPQTPAAILARYAAFDESARQDAVATLASRPGFARILLDAIGAGRIPRADLSAFTARQLLRFDDPAIREAVRAVWGELRNTPEDKRALIERHKARLTPMVLAEADRSRGREVFERHCASCHVLFDAGRKIGPDLTGSQRTNLDYVLENLIDPSAAVGRDYQTTLIQTGDGRLLTGIVLGEDSNTLSVQTSNDRVILATNEIDVRKLLPISLMPDELASKLSDEEVRDLVSYLASPAQVPPLNPKP